MASWRQGVLSTARWYSSGMHDIWQVAILLLAMIAGYASLRGFINQRFNAVNQRFDDMRDLWRAELKRVEEVLDARLKHLEEHR